MDTRQETQADDPTRKKSRYEPVLKKIYEDVKQQEDDLLLAGFAVLIKDTEDYCNNNGLDDPGTRKLHDVYLAMQNHDRFYWRAVDGRLHLDLREAGLPSDIARKAAEGDYDLSALFDDRIVNHEWTRGPGWHAFKTYTKLRKAEILKRPPQDKYQNLSQTPPPPRDYTVEELEALFFDSTKPPHVPYVDLVEKLATTNSIVGCFWFPLLMYLAVLLVRSDFQTLSDPVND